MTEILKQIKTPNFSIFVEFIKNLLESMKSNSCCFHFLHRIDLFGFPCLLYIRSLYSRYLNLADASSSFTLHTVEVCKSCLICSFSKYFQYIMICLSNFFLFKYFFIFIFLNPYCTEMLHDYMLFPFLLAHLSD